MDPWTDRFLLKACVRCGGDLALDDGDWLCLQCGRYYYARPKPATLPHWREWLARPLPGDGRPPPPKSASITDILTGSPLRTGRLWPRAVLAPVFVHPVFVQW
jgi:hypothetical protein